MKDIAFRPIENSILINLALKLPKQGKVFKTENNLAYLKIHNDFIYELQPLLNDKEIIKPTYFDKDGIGAHISIIYPEENEVLQENDIGGIHNFNITGLFAAALDEKEYFALGVDAPSLLLLRKNYHLQEMLFIKNILVPFHVTIGVKKLK